MVVSFWKQLFFSISQKETTIWNNDETTIENGCFIQSVYTFKYRPHCARSLAFTKAGILSVGGFTSFQ